MFQKAFFLSGSQVFWRSFFSIKWLIVCQWLYVLWCCKCNLKPSVKWCGCFCPLPASLYCPKDGVYHAESSHCFQIVPGELSWTDARQQCLVRGGDLAIVRSDALRNLLAHKVTQWVFLFVWGAEMGPHHDILRSFCMYILCHFSSDFQ